MLCAGGQEVAANISQTSRTIFACHANRQTDAAHAAAAEAAAEKEEERGTQFSCRRSSLTNSVRNGVTPSLSLCRRLSCLSAY